MAKHIWTKQITPKIVYVETRTQELLGKTFCRVQEHYESPEWAGKIFTLGQYREWYTREFGAFDYYSTVCGTNLPSSCLKPFLEGLFDPLSEEEKVLIEFFRCRQDDFYIIGGTTEGDSTATFNHEVTHGLFATCPEYRKEVLRLVARVKEEYPERMMLLLEYFKESAYAEKHYDDEINAYISCDSEYLRDKNIKFKAEIISQFETLRSTYLSAEREKTDAKVRVYMTGDLLEEK